MIEYADGIEKTVQATIDAMCDPTSACHASNLLEVRAGMEAIKDRMMRVIRQQMDMATYQSRAMETCVRKDVNMAVLGICGEAGEVAEVLKKHVYHGKGDDEQTRRRLIEEAGDVLWYIACLAHSLNVSIEYIAKLNIDKLQAKKASWQQEKK